MPNSPEKSGSFEAHDPKLVSAIEVVQQAKEFAWLETGSVIISDEEIAALTSAFGLDEHQMVAVRTVAKGEARRGIEGFMFDKEVRGLTDD